MTWRLSTQDPEFEAQFTRFLAAPRNGDRDVSGIVGEIITAVRRDGDAALLSHTRKLDRWAATAESRGIAFLMLRTPISSRTRPSTCWTSFYGMTTKID